MVRKKIVRPQPKNHLRSLRLSRSLLHQERLTNSSQILNNTRSRSHHRRTSKKTKGRYEKMILHYKSYNVKGEDANLCEDRKTFKLEETTERLHEVTCPKCRKILMGKEIID